MKADSPFIVWLAGKIYSKVQRLYFKRHKKRMPVILITGTVGKSSQTVLINRLFEKEGWKIFSGTTAQKNLNSLTGLIMVLSGFRISFEGSRSFWKKVNFVRKGLWFWLFEGYKLEPKTILIYEVGYDHQDESSAFQKIFKQGFDVLIVTATTWEHAQGFDSKLNIVGYNKIQTSLPKYWKEILLNNEYTATLRNIALEQITLLPLAKHFALPPNLGGVDNWVIDNFQNALSTHLVSSERGADFSLIANLDYNFSPNYLLPLTFAKTAYILELLANHFQLPKNTVQEVIHDLNLPFSRFSLLEGILGTTIVDSTYNSDPQSLTSFLNLCTEIIQNTKTMQDLESKKGQSVMAPNHYLVLGEMRELGELSKAAHSEALDQIMELGKTWGDYLEGVFLIGEEWLKCNDDGIIKTHEDVSFIRYQKQLFKVYHKVGDLVRLFNPETIRPGCWFWIKGSQNTIFLEALVAHLLANPNDVQKLCRQGEEWDVLRLPYL